LLAAVSSTDLDADLATVAMLADGIARTLLGRAASRVVIADLGRATPHQQQRTQDFHGSHYIATKAPGGKLDHAAMVTYRHCVIGRQPPSGVGYLAMTDAA
jgi:hypothetical protein